MTEDNRPMTEDNRPKMHRIKKNPQELDPRESPNPQRDNPTRWEKFKQEAAYAGKAAGTFVKDNWPLIAAFAGGMVVKTLLEKDVDEFHVSDIGDNNLIAKHVDTLVYSPTNGHPGYLIEDPETGTMYKSKNEAMEALGVSRKTLDSRLEDGDLINRGVNTGLDFA